ncbi:MAG: GNAT family N-acetyltransferase [Candidatus Pristimantibacillus lignocellulolyticus]|uniref:GNAT family N-acetyltransferase n=1 Tax=Candidatus Pristimantibacillus lignocellulolyticus TaxID=2994561 RepID=A0A9J6ZH45_9BACL|nr:MAG: GNAT family N-acetyltransferase [Candidatus Pristimantibacillus lignocellulolyticus]
MKLRSIKLSDTRKITELFEEVLSEECYEQTIEAFGRQLSWDSDLVLVAEADEKIVGVIIGTIDNNKGYYYRIAVSASYQRQGVGKQLANALKQRFEEKKVTKIYVTADEHNEPILPLFESIGFVASDFIRSFQKLSIVAG